MGTHLSGLPDLAALRQEKGLSLSAMANDTKITTRYLEAIEQGNFSKLPGGFYNLSYIRQYARAVEFDEAELLAYYYKVTGCEPVNISAPPSAFRPRSLSLVSLTDWLTARPLLNVSTSKLPKI
jgi:cytoskeletal protein RodZ